jgi:hypothetical protein
MGSIYGGLLGTSVFWRVILYDSQSLQKLNLFECPQTMIASLNSGD